MTSGAEVGGESRRDRAFRAWAVVLLGLIDGHDEGDAPPDGPMPVQAPAAHPRRPELGPAAEA